MNTSKCDLDQPLWHFKKHSNPLCLRKSYSGQSRAHLAVSIEYKFGTKAVCVNQVDLSVSMITSCTLMANLLDDVMHKGKTWTVCHRVCGDFVLLLIKIAVTCNQ